MELDVTGPRGSHCYARERVVGEGVICQVRLHPESGADGLRDVSGGTGIDFTGVAVLVTVYIRARARADERSRVLSEASVFAMRSTSGEMYGRHAMLSYIVSQ